MSKLKRILHLTYVIIKRTMGMIVLTRFDGSTVEINEDQIFAVIEEGGVIILVYKNGAFDRFPALDTNLSAVYKIQQKLKKSTP